MAGLYDKIHINTGSRIFFSATDIHQRKKFRDGYYAIQRQFSVPISDYSAELEPFVIMHGQLGFYFLDNFNDHGNHNQQGSTTKSKRCRAGIILKN